MTGLGPLRLTAGIAGDLHRASRAGRAGIMARRTARLQRLVTDARASSPLLP